MEAVTHMGHSLCWIKRILFYRVIKLLAFVFQ